MRTVAVLMLILAVGVALGALGARRSTRFHNPSRDEPGVIHNVINTSKTAPLHLSAVFIVDSGKPLATPAPAK